MEIVLQNRDGPRHQPVPVPQEVSACWLSVQTTDQDDPEDGGLDFDDVFIAGSDGQRFHRQVNAPAEPRGGFRFF